MHNSALSRTFHPAEREVLEADQRREHERLTAERAAKIERIRTGAGREADSSDSRTPPWGSTPPP